MDSYIQKLVEVNLLLHVKYSPISRENGVILVACGDCDKSDELISFEKRLCQETAGNSRVHLLTLNGGALAFHPFSPVNQHGKSNVFIHELNETVPMKQVPDIAIYGHHVCGKANGLGLQVNEYFYWLAKGASYIRYMMPRVNVVCKMHVDAPVPEVSESPDSKFKTYYFDDRTFTTRHEQGKLPALVSSLAA